jgi:hypothetical protein
MPRPYVVRRGEGLTGDTSLKFFAEWVTADDWPTRDAIGATYGITFPR